jgi:hypothetical protein
VDPTPEPDEPEITLADDQPTRQFVSRRCVQAASSESKCCQAPRHVAQPQMWVLRLK